VFGDLDVCLYTRRKKHSTAGGPNRLGGLREHQLRPKTKITFLSFVFFVRFQNANRAKQKHTGRIKLSDKGEKIIDLYF